MTTPLIPDLPIERLDVYQDDALGHGSYAIRVTPTGAIEDGKPDNISLGLSHGCAHMSFRITPSQLVHLANTMLTDGERSAIVFPLQGVGAA